MIRTTCCALSIVVVLGAVGASGAAPSDSSTLFPYQSTLAPGGRGLNRLVLPPAITARCRPDLSDVRLFDAEGREAPYLVFAGALEQSAGENVISVRPDVRTASRSENRTALGPTRYTESYELTIPALPAAASAWELVLDVAQAEFVARISLTMDGAPVDTDNRDAVFRLRNPQAERLRFPLETTGHHLTVTVIQDGVGWLKPQFLLEARRTLPIPRRGMASLELVELRNSGTTTEAVFERPPGLVPGLLTVATSTGAFVRHMTVWDEGPDASASPLGSRTLVRIDAIAPVVVDEIPLRPARGTRLRLVIDNGDSPPLADLGCAVRVAQPVLFFSAPAAREPMMLRYGGGRALRPRYDLDALAPLLSLSVDQETTTPFLDPAQSHQASLGAGSANPAFDPDPVLAFAMRPGAELDARPFSHRRLVTVPLSDEGLTRISLHPEDLAVLRTDLGDVRFVDRDGRQWPYLLREKAAMAEVALTLQSQRSGDGVTRYLLIPAAAPVAPVQLEMTIDVPYFDRGFRLRGTTDEGTAADLANGRLVRLRGDPRPRTVALGGRRLERLELEVTDGDDASLPIAQARLGVWVPELYVTAPAGEYQLLLGDPAMDRPVYELERVRSTVLAVPASNSSAGSLEDNPAFRATSRLAESGTAQTVGLWVVLGMVVVGLAALTLRLGAASSDS